MPSVLLGVPLRTHSDLLLVSHLHAQTLVTSTLNIEPSAVAAGTLDLDGDNEELEVLRSIEIDGVALSEGSDCALTEDGLSLLKLPLSKFVLTTAVAIKPQDNTQLSGNLRSLRHACSHGGWRPAADY